MAVNVTDHQCVRTCHDDLQTIIELDETGPVITLTVSRHGSKRAGVVCFVEGDERYLFTEAVSSPYTLKPALDLSEQIDGSFEDSLHGMSYTKVAEEIKSKLSEFYSFG